jgi:hypothetical protein
MKDKPSGLPVLHPVKKEQFQQPTDGKYKKRWSHMKNFCAHKIQVYCEE